MDIHVLTLFPEMFDSPFDQSIVHRAREKGLINLQLHNIRDYAQDKHKVTDDYTFGGGPGMVMKPEPIFEAVDTLKSEHELNKGTPIVLLTPRGRVFSQQIAQELSQHSELVLICGHYEGVDERVATHLSTDEISLGDYVLTGGELAAMVVVDSVARLVPGVLGSTESLEDESHSSGLLQYPQYTRPAEYRGWKVPDVLLSGHHQEIDRWRRQQSLLHTLKRRPDLLKYFQLTDEEKRWLEEIESSSIDGLE